MVLSFETPAASNPKHHDRFWTRQRAANLLPLLTSLMFHAVLLAVGIMLYQAVQQVTTPKHDQVIIPESTITPAVFPSPIVHPGSLVDPSRPPSQDMIHQPIETPDIPFGTGSDGPADSPFPGPKKSPPGGSMFPSGTPGLPWGPPGGTAAVGPRIVNMQETGKKVIYLCDASGSMLGVFGTLKQELRTSISNLDVSEGMQFNVIFFSDDNYLPLFKEGMRLATNDNKKLAMDFIDNAVATGGTQPLPAIRFAVQEKPDVLYVFTDGFDQVSNFNEVLQAFRQGNTNGRTHVDCIFLQSDEDPKLEQVLQQIAREGQGKFEKIRKSDL